MNREQFEREKNYQVMLSIAKSMEKQRMVTSQEYTKINKMLVEKYRPVLGSIYL